jgi:hypothetical protein
MGALLPEARGQGVATVVLQALRDWSTLVEIRGRSPREPHHLAPMEIDAPLSRSACTMQAVRVHGAAIHAQQTPLRRELPSLCSPSGRLP